MKHAGPTTLEQLPALLASLRSLPGVVERTPGCFYRKGSAYLHFHEDPMGLFADVKLDGKTFQRLRVSTVAEQAALLDAIAASQSGG